MNSLSIIYTNTTIINLAGYSKIYLTLSDSKIKNAIKITTWLLTAGILPAIAYAVVTYCYEPQINFLKKKASQSLEETLDVPNIIKKYRLQEVDKHGIAVATAKTIGENYPAFLKGLEESKINDSAQWLKKLEMTERYSTTHPLGDIAKIVDCGRGKGIECEYSVALNRIDDYDLESQERLRLFKELAPFGIVPHKGVATDKEGYDIVMTLAQREKIHYDMNLIYKCMKDYELEQKERFIVARALTVTELTKLNDDLKKESDKVKSPIKHGLENIDYNPYIPISLTNVGVLAKFMLSEDQHLEIIRLIVNQFFLNREKIRKNFSNTEAILENAMKQFLLSIKPFNFSLYQKQELICMRKRTDWTPSEKGTLEKEGLYKQK